MASSSSSSSSTAAPFDETTLPHYVTVCKGHWRGNMKVEVGQTVRTFKDEIAQFMNKYGAHPAINVTSYVTADSFQLRPGDAKDIILEDAQLVHSVLPYKFVTPTAYVVMLDQYGDATPIEDPPVASPRVYTAEEMEALKAKIRAEIDAKYACISTTN